MPYGTQPTMRAVWARLWWDVRNIANKRLNPFVLNGEGDLQPVKRTGLQDITHAIKNVFVEGWRRYRRLPYQ